MFSLFSLFRFIGVLVLAGFLWAGPATAQNATPVYGGLTNWPQDLAWHKDTLWGADLTGPNSVTQLDLQEWRDEPDNAPFDVRDHVRKTYTRIKTRNGDVVRLSQPTGITSDGRYLWLATHGDQTIWQLSAGKEHLEEIRHFVRKESGIKGLAWDSRRNRLWMSDQFRARVYQIEPGTGKTLSSFKSPSRIGQIKGLTYDGRYLRLATYHDLTIWTLSREGKVIGKENAPTRAPSGLAWDGQALWIAEDHEDRIFRQ